MIARVELRHMSRGRLRLHLSGPNDGRGSLSRVARGLEDNPKVSRVSVNPITRTLLVLHEGDAQELLAYGEHQKLFSLVRPPPPAPVRNPVRPSQRLVAAISDGMKSLDDGVMTSSRGKVDLPSVAIAALFGAAVWRARGGSLLPSAVSLVSIAFGMLGMKRRT